MSCNANTTISSLSAQDIPANLGELGELMFACVQDGASIGYVRPFSRRDSEAFWTEKVLPAVQAGARLLLVARHGDRLIGSVQLDYDTPPNQPHRADVRKLLVHPEFRRQGIALALMAELERRSRALGRSLLTLDTRTGDSAEPLYTSLGYRTVGIIPGFCRDTGDAGRLDATTIMYKQL